MSYRAGVQCRTRGGDRARIYATDGTDGKLHGAILWPDGWNNRVWLASGHVWDEPRQSENDLVDLDDLAHRREMILLKIAELEDTLRALDDEIAAR